MVMKKILRMLFLTLVCLVTAGIVVAGDKHVQASLESVNGSGVTGSVNAVALPHGGTHINLVVSGLQPGEAYISLYYDNHVCDLEPYSDDDVVGNYTGNGGGNGQAVNKVDDDLDEINSVPVR